MISDISSIRLNTQYSYSACTELERSRCLVVSHSSRLLCSGRVHSERIECRFFFFSSRRRHTRSDRDWSSDVVLFRSSHFITTEKQAYEKCFQNLHYIERHEEHTIAHAIQTSYKKTKVFI